MKLKKVFLAAVLPTLAVSLLTSCNVVQPVSTSKTPSFVPAEDEDEEIVYEIGDTVKEWTHSVDFDKVPLAVPSSNAGTGNGEIVNDFGQNDKCSLKYTVKVGNNNQGYISSDALDKPYFTDDDAKNGDIISLYYYVPANSNVASLQLQIVPVSGNNALSGDVIEINEEKEES